MWTRGRAYFEVGPNFTFRLHLAIFYDATGSVCKLPQWTFSRISLYFHVTDRTATDE